MLEKEDLQAIERLIAPLEMKVKDLEAKFDNRIKEVERSIKQLDKRGIIIEQSVADIKRDVIEIDGKINKIGRNIADLQSHMKYCTDSKIEIVSDHCRILDGKLEILQSSNDDLRRLGFFINCEYNIKLAKQQLGV